MKCVNKLLRDITTGKDNDTHEIIRTFMVVTVCILVVAFIVGTIMEIRHSVVTGEWDLQSYFQAIVTFILGIGTFLLSGAGAIKLKTPSETSPLPPTA